MGSIISLLYNVLNAILYYIYGMVKTCNRILILTTAPQLKLRLELKDKFVMLNVHYILSGAVFNLMTS